MKTIIIVAPHFPPSAMPPAQRVRLLVRHLHEFDWHPVVLTVDHYYREEVSDPWMVELAGKNYEKIDLKCLDQRKTRRFGIGDLGLRMLPFLFFQVRKIARKNKADFVLYPVPPWYIMVVAPFVKWATGIPYGIDFIDPWVRQQKKDENIKAKISQWIARRFEGFAVKRSAAIFAVSQGILNDLLKRYPSVKDKALAAVPYGVELNDYSSINRSQAAIGPALILIRYIGAVSDSMLPVVKALLMTMEQVQLRRKIRVEFIGTSYAGSGLAQPRIQPFLDEIGLQEFVTEAPDRVTYRRAVELTRSADILLLVGDMTPYYAASKLMGLIASRQPFFAFLQRDSFPAQFLRQLNYPFIIEYTATAGDLPEQRQQAVEEKLIALIDTLPDFRPVSTDEPSFRQHTAWGMTKSFVDTIQKAEHGQATL